MNFYQLSWLISLFHEFKMINDEYGDTLNWWNKMKKLLIKGEKLRETIKKRTSNNKSFWDTFFFLNKKRDFFYYHSKLGFRSQSIKFLNPTLLLIFLHGLNNWLQITYVQWNAREISKDLKKKGIYFNNVAYGPATRRFLKKKINNLVFFWYLIVLFFCFLFSDNRISDLNFIDWFSSINLGTNLIQQIRTKYKYLEIK
jgi:preprotein translocase subunit SecY